MNARDAIKNAINTGHMICSSYLQDLSDADLLVRPVEGANHIAWQLGHLISSENHMIELVCPGSMPALPDGFAEKYTSETSKLDDGPFENKADYLQLCEEQRSGTFSALEKLSDDDLDKPAPESLHQIAKTVGEVFGMQATHWVMHGGQWAVVRRALGREPLF